jgi:hypothetical protein
MGINAPSIGRTGGRVKADLTGFFRGVVTSEKKGGFKFQLCGEFTSGYSQNDPIFLIDNPSRVFVKMDYFADYRATIAQSTENEIELLEFIGSSGGQVVEKDILDVNGCPSGPTMVISGQRILKDLSGDSGRYAVEVDRSGGTGRTVCRRTGNWRFEVLIRADDVTINRTTTSSVWDPLTISLEQL